ncbi:protein-glutamate O-methyltransferase CheR [candidate division KSB3 bacterium]|uniref:protein-glutamate O-methyltransferase n=1 Tax=candidate division KSB3 bacterium TaxID=2044937 RepID=A0A9D5K052_9BACT|nr:protein-glutamate O-methyltransferase CheR [candidate division KSB3 bacterium]MBD3327355.1 protein-glutamate O-methyltransferase CheR [candidate division KSB3 bacterium]
MQSQITTQLPYTQDDFKLLRDAIYTYSGIFISDDYQGIFMRRLERRLLMLAMDSFHEYYYYLKYDQQNNDEFKKLMDVITIKETYFFREVDQMKTLVNEVIPELRREKPRETIKIWSAACSTGEEAYTIAMLCIEKGYHLGNSRVEIFANDISQEAVQKAKQGVYKQTSFRNTDQAYLHRFFTEHEKGTFKIRDEAKEPVNFFCINLLDHNRLTFLPTFDVIFCRNLLIYFNEHSKRNVIETFYQKLYPERYLFLGHSESLINFTYLFKLRHFQHSLVYQRA